MVFGTLTALGSMRALAVLADLPMFYGAPTEAWRRRAGYAAPIAARSRWISGMAMLVVVLGPAPAYGDAVIQPSTVDFGSQPQGVQGAPATVELVNTGRNAFRVYRAEVNSGPDNADFVVVKDGCSGLDVAPQARCPLEVAFKPTGVGATSQTVGILVSGPDYRTFGERAAVVTLSGVGTAEGAVTTTLPPPPGQRSTAPIPLGLMILVAGVGALGLGFLIMASARPPALGD